MKSTVTNTIIIGLAAGAFASWVKAKVEPPLQRLGEDIFVPTEEELERLGADVSDHPENMPPAVLADRVYTELTSHELTKKEQIQSMSYIHYGLGMFIGVVYAFAANENKFYTNLGGISAGITVWSLTHGSTLPALELQDEVKKMPKSWWVWEFGSHVIFGVAMEQSRKYLASVLR